MSIFEPNLAGFGQPRHLLSNGPDDEPISAILNEAKHVFEWHKEGLWNSEYKDGFAALLVPFIRNHPKLIRQVIDIDERVFSMVAYRAVELEKAVGAGGSYRPGPVVRVCPVSGRLGNMAKVLLATGMIVACTASAASLPTGSSAAEWDTGVICTSGTSGEHCSEYQSTLTMWSINGEICGLISETSARRSPEAWFRGRPYKEGILVQYVESFQNIPGDYGWAVIKLEGDRLSWAVLKSPEGSYIESEARLKPASTAEVPMTTARSCSDWEAERSGLTVRLPRDGPLEVGNR